MDEAELDEAEGGETIPIHRVALRTFLGLVISGGSTLLPLFLLILLAGPDSWGRRHWAFVVVAALTGGASFACADALTRRRRARGWRKFIPLVAIGAATSALVVVVNIWVWGVAEGRDPYESVSLALREFASYAQSPIEPLLFVVAVTLPFLLGGVGRSLGPPGVMYFRPTLELTCAGGMASTLFLLGTLPGSVSKLGFLVALTFWALPTSIVASLFIVDRLEPLLVDWLVKLTSPT